MASVSSLLKSAASTRKRVAQQKDAEMQFTWESSAQTREEFNEYVKYLKKRQESATDSSELLNYLSKERSVRRSFTSNEIQRRSQDIYFGNGSTQQKIDAIINLYNEAIDSGDNNLAQNLISQYQTLDIQLQNEYKTAANAAKKLQKANVDQYGDAADSLMKSLSDISQAFKQYGNAGLDSETKKFIKNNKSIFKALGISLPKDAVIDYGALVDAGAEAVLELYGLAADAAKPYDDVEYNKWRSKAVSFLNGKQVIETPAGNLDYYQAKEWARNPGMFRESVDDMGERTLKESVVSRYEINRGRLTRVYGDTSNRNDLTTEQEKQLKDLGFRVGGKTARGFRVEITEDVRKWFPKIDNLPDDILLVPTDSGWQFANTNSSGYDELFTIANDNRGLAGVFKEVIRGPGFSQPLHLQGQYGFNQADNTRMRQEYAKKPKSAIVATGRDANTGGIVFNQVTKNSSKTIWGFDQNQQKVINKRLDQGWSWENIAKSTGVDLNTIKRYSQQTRPNYGIKNYVPKTASMTSAANPLLSNNKWGFSEPQQLTINKRLDQGWSWENIAKETKVGLGSIKAYSEATRPGYGIR